MQCEIISKWVKSWVGECSGSRLKLVLKIKCNLRHCPTYRQKCHCQPPVPHWVKQHWHPVDAWLKRFASASGSCLWEMTSHHWAIIHSQGEVHLTFEWLLSSLNTCFHRVFVTCYKELCYESIPGAGINYYSHFIDDITERLNSLPQVTQQLGLGFKLGPVWLEACSLSHYVLQLSNMEATSH